MAVAILSCICSEVHSLHPARGDGDKVCKEMNIVDQAREEVREMFYHGYNNYLTHAFPDDELKPMSCTGRKREARGTLDDALGGFVPFFRSKIYRSGSP
jgi:hypothetical protein